MEDLKVCDLDLVFEGQGHSKNHIKMSVLDILNKKMYFQQEDHYFIITLFNTHISTDRNWKHISLASSDFWGCT